MNLFISFLKANLPLQIKLVEGTPHVKKSDCTGTVSVFVSFQSVRMFPPEEKTWSPFLAAL